MSDYDNTNKGILSRNQRKEQPNHPDHTGSINIEGREYWLSAWVKEKKDGSGRFFSLSVKPKDAQAAPAPAAKDLDDEIPF